LAGEGEEAGGAEADGAGEAAAARLSGPFWPQPAAKDSVSSKDPAAVIVTTRAAKL